jgi:hypothetical protein
MMVVVIREASAFERFALLLMGLMVMTLTSPLTAGTRCAASGIREER